MNKAEIRRQVLEKRNALKKADRIDKSNRILKLLEEQEFFKNAQYILAYFSHNSEVDTLGLMNRWVKEKNFLLPRLTSDKSFLALPLSSLNDLELNRFGIPEPPVSSENKVSQEQELIIVPGVAFDRKGGRIGMGKGYYDRFLNGQKDTLKVALAYSEQVLDSVPQDPYDELVDFIITEKEVIRCQFSP